MLKLFPLDWLEVAQQGWRWIRDKHGSVTENPVRNKRWIVIADRNGDAIVVDSSTADGAVTGHIGSYNVKSVQMCTSALCSVSRSPAEGWYR